MDIPILKPEQRWECPNCDMTDVTHFTIDQLQSRHRMHFCPGLKMLSAPYVPAGTRCKVEAVEREDYVGGETVTYDSENRPVMAIETTREDGNDVAVLAPCVNPMGGPS